MKVLVFGDAALVAKKVAETAWADAHQVTLFDPEATASEIVADPQAKSDIAVYCSTKPAVGLSASCSFIKGTAEKLVVVSSIDTALGVLPDIAEIESVVQSSFGENSLVVHIGLAISEADPNNPLTYWLDRLKLGDEVVAPGDKNAQLPLIDIKDAARTVCDLLESSKTGTIAAQIQPPQFWSILWECRAICGSDATFTWVSEMFLAGQQVEPWIELPLWLKNDGLKAYWEKLDAVETVESSFQPIDFTKILESTYRSINSENFVRSGETHMSIDDERVILDEWHKLSVPYRV